MRILRKRRGNAMVEFALMWAVVFPIIAGTGQFGNAFYQYNNLCSGVRNAARYASVQTYLSTDTTVPTTLATEVKNIVRYGNPAPAQGALLVSNVPAEKIEVAVTFTKGVPAQVSVKVLEFSIDTVFKTFTITNKPESKFPFVGRWAPVN